MRGSRQAGTGATMTCVTPSIRVFLLSPAHCGGQRAQLLFRQEARFDLARRLRSRDGATLGEAFSFMSGLYFRGKLAYARAFARTAASLSGVLVITPCQGLRSPDVRVDLPLLRDARALAAALEDHERADVVLLGSVASAKYVEPLLEVFGVGLIFPAEFAGRSDVSRGGLLLRCVDEGRELHYVPLLTASRHGPRPARLVPAQGILARTQHWLQPGARPT